MNLGQNNEAKVFGKVPIVAILQETLMDVYCDQAEPHPSCYL